MGQREDPLAGGNLGEYTVQLVRGCVGHSASTAGRTEAPLLTGERDKPIIATGRAANPNEAVAEQVTRQELAKFAFYEFRHAVIPYRSVCQKGLEVLLYHCVEE